VARSRVVRSGPRRKTTWIGPADQPFVTVPSSGKLLVASFDPAANGLVSPTVVRTRGQVAVASLGNATNDLVGAYGMCIVTDRAFAAGVGSIPGPFTDSGWDGWFVWRSFSLSLVQATGTGFIISSQVQEIDSKAMRKITNDETMVLVAEAQGNTYEISMPLRTLMKLS